MATPNARAQSPAGRCRNATELRATPTKHLIDLETWPSDLSHARRFSHPDSCPKISFGQVLSAGATRQMPVPVHLHHGLSDGYHVGLFLAAFQRRLG